MDGYTTHEALVPGDLVKVHRQEALLMMDTFKAHCVDDIQDLLARNNTLIPGGCTSKLQPLDVSLNE